MTIANNPWPCPVCAEILPAGSRDCPLCSAPSEWIDLLRAHDFAIRRFELWKLEGVLSKEEYRTILDECRKRRETMVRAAQAGQPLPECGLPRQGECWYCRQATAHTTQHCRSCGAPLQSAEVNLLRYRSFLCHEIKRHEKEGRVRLAESEAFLTETPDQQIDLLARLEKGWSPLFRPGQGSP